MNMLIDPVILLTVRWALAALFGFAVIHKFRSMSEFREALRAYQLLPERWTAFAAHALVAIELLVVLGLLTNNDAWTLVAAALLCLYALAMLINLARGRRELDCGCGGTSGRQKISIGLALRNLVLAAVAVMSVQLPTTARMLSWLDWFTVLAASATMALIWAAASQLSGVRLRKRSH